MKNTIIPVAVLLLAAMSFSSCKKCFQCSVANPATQGVFWQEPEVTCGEKVDDHQSVLEKAYQCATCSQTFLGVVTSYTYCDNAGELAEYIESEEQDPDVTCVVVSPVVTCYEAD